MTAAQERTPATHLLLVEDDRLVLATLVSGLAAAGYSVTTAESSEDAEAWLAGGQRPTLAIVDLRLPGQGGLHLAMRLQALDHIPFMVFSAHGDAASIDEAARLGALGYAVKPMGMVQLIAAIETALRRAEELNALRETRQRLQRALDGERDISIATGILMGRRGLTRAEAFALLRGRARGERRKLAELAAELIAGGVTGM